MMDKCPICEKETLVHSGTGDICSYCKHIPNQSSCSFMYVEQLEAETERLKGTLTHVLAKCSGYDGYETVDGLKELVDAVVLIVANQETLTPNEPKLRDNIQLMAVRKLNKKIMHSSATKSAEIDRLNKCCDDIASGRKDNAELASNYHADIKLLKRMLTKALSAFGKNKYYQFDTWNEIEQEMKGKNDG